jgi:hypothetical protein
MIQQKLLVFILKFLPCNRKSTLTLYLYVTLVAIGASLIVLPNGRITLQMDGGVTKLSKAGIEPTITTVTVVEGYRNKKPIISQALF